MRDIKRAVERDIAKFKATGKLPRDYDVQVSHVAPNSDGPYWEYINRYFEGQEPFGNSGDVVPADYGAMSPQARKLAAWLADDMPGLTRADKELFRLTFVQGLAQGVVAVMLGVTRATVNRRVARLRKRIATLVEL